MFQRKRNISVKSESFTIGRDTATDVSVVPDHDINKGSPSEGSKEHNYPPVPPVHKTDKWQK